MLEPVGRCAGDVECSDWGEISANESVSLLTACDSQCSLAQSLSDTLRPKNTSCWQVIILLSRCCCQQWLLSDWHSWDTCIHHCWPQARIQL